MSTGEVKAIHIASSKGAEVHAIESVRIAAGQGLEGDRNFGADGPIAPHRQVTLVESEVLEALATEKGIGLAPGETRRNITTRGVPLNDLVGKEFRVGPVLLRGIQLCEPCSYLTKMTGKPLKTHLAGRGGLRAEALESGVVRLGDLITY